MPALSYFYYCDLNETTTFIGTCEYSKRVEFKEKIDSLCIAMEWSTANITVKHHYQNSVITDLNAL